MTTDTEITLKFRIGCRASQYAASPDNINHYESHADFIAGAEYLLPTLLEAVSLLETINELNKMAYPTTYPDSAVQKKIEVYLEQLKK